MKKILVAIMAVFTFMVNSFAQDKIEIKDVQIPEKGSANLEVNLISEQRSYIAFQFDLKLPAGISAKANASNLTDRATSVSDGWSVFFKQVDAANNIYNCVAYNGDNAAISGTSGTVLNIVLTAADNETLVQGYTGVGTITGAIMSTKEQKYQSAEGTFNIEIIENRIELNETVGVTDETPTGVQNVRVNRTIKAGNWNTICLPFAMTADQVKTAFGNGVKLADFIGCEGDGNQNTASTSIKVKFNTVDAIEANHPYLIKVEEALTSFTADEVTISPDEENAIVQKDKTSRPVAYNSFVGTYNPSTIIPIGCLFLNSNKFYYSNGNSKLKAFRAYFDFGVNWLEEAPYAESKIEIFVDDDATSIDGIGYQRITEGVYDLSGRKIQLKDGDLNKLQKGVYIIDGKKVTIK